MIWLIRFLLSNINRDFSFSAAALARGSNMVSCDHRIGVLVPVI